MGSNFLLSNSIIEGNILRNGEFDVLGIVDSYPRKKMLTFLENGIYAENLKANPDVSCVITTEELGAQLYKESSFGIITTNNPRIAFFKFHNDLSINDLYKRKAFDTKIGPNCNISSLAYVSKKNVIIGNNVTIEEFVSIKDHVIIGDNTIIRAGTVIGSSGFEFKNDEGKLIPVEHLGGVIIGDDVEIKCNNVIDKAIYPWDDTEIGDNTKIANLINISHACKIGKHVMIAANSVIGGRVNIENWAWIGLGSTLRNGIHIGQNARCNMGSVVTKNVELNISVSGNFAIEHSKFIEKIKKVG